MYTCKELLLLSDPDRYMDLVLGVQGFYHSPQLQPKIFYCLVHALVAFTYDFELAKKKIWLCVSEVAFSNEILMMGYLFCISILLR